MLTPTPGVPVDPIAAVGTLLIAFWHLLLVGLPLVTITALGLTLPLWMDPEKGWKRGR